MAGVIRLDIINLNDAQIGTMGIERAGCQNGYASSEEAGAHGQDGWFGKGDESMEVRREKLKPRFGWMYGVKCSLATTFFNVWKAREGARESR